MAWPHWLPPLGMLLGDSLGGGLAWWWGYESGRRAADPDRWHGRTLHLQRVVMALVRGDRTEALRLVRETGDGDLMAQVGRLNSPSEKS